VRPPADSPRGRPFTTVLDVLRSEIDHDAFDAALLSIEVVAADLGYGDIRALPGSIAWTRQLRTLDKRIGILATGDRARAALELAGIAEVFDEITIGTCAAATVLTAIAELGAAPGRTIVVAATAAGVAAARNAAVFRVIALARGLSAPEELRTAGASMVVADLQELVRAIT
jgi:alpha,alpha-trehalose phosphorylase